MKKLLCAVFVLAVLGGALPPVSAAGLTLVIRDGKVSLDAQDVTLRQILAEWARVGKTKIINLEQVTSGPMTLKFDGVPEQEALDIVLRALPGYVAAPRITPIADASIFDRVMIMASTTRVADLPRPGQGFAPLGAGATQLRSSFPTPAPVVPGPLPLPPDDSNVNLDAAIAAAAAAGLISTPGQNPTPFMPGPLQPPARLGGPGEQTVPGTQTPSPTNPWNAPVGATRPGLPTPAPATTAPQPGRGGLPRLPQADQ